MPMINKSHKAILQEPHTLFSQPVFDSASHFFILSIMMSMKVFHCRKEMKVARY